jgi:hypothetical protein
MRFRVELDTSICKGCFLARLGLAEKRHSDTQARENTDVAARRRIAKP